MEIFNKLTNEAMILINKNKFGIQENEFDRFKLAWSLRFFYQIGFIVAWTIITAMFVEHFGISNLIFLFLGEGLLFIVGTFLSEHLWSKLKLKTFINWCSILTVIFIGLAFLFEPDDLKFFIFIIFAKDLFFGQLNIALYRHNESLFSPTEAQKLMPKVESAITIGSIIGALLTVQFLGFMETEFVLTIWMGVMAGIGALIYNEAKFLHTIPKFNEHKSEPKRRSPVGEAMSAIRNVKFLRYLFLIILLQSAIFTIIEFEFTKDVQSHIIGHDAHLIEPGSLHASFFDIAKEKLTTATHSTKEAIHDISTKLIANETLAHDLGMFHLIFGMFALLIQLVLTTKVLARIGVVGSIITFFAIILAAIGALLGGITNISFVRMMQHGFHSIGEAGYHISFYSIFEHSRESIRLLFEGIIKPLGIILGAGIIFFMGHSSFALAAVLALTIIIAGILSRKSFTDLSIANLQEEEDIDGKLHSIEVLGQNGHHRPYQVLGQELVKKGLHQIIRRKIIATCTKINYPQIIHDYSKVLMDEAEDHEIKISILESTLEIKELNDYFKKNVFCHDHFLKTLRLLFETTEHNHLKKLTVMNLFKNLPNNDLILFFKENMNKHDDQIKSIFLRSCTVLKDDPDIAYYLRPYLSHENHRLRGHAIISLWEHESRVDLHAVIDDLLNSDNEEEQVTGVYAIGEVKEKERENVLWAILENQNISGKLRMHALISLAKLGSRNTVNGLLEIIFSEDIELANSTYKMLNRAPEEIRSQIQQEAQIHVSQKVFSILQPRQIKKVEDLQKLPSKNLAYLKRLYEMTERYDELLVLERLT